jgi:hypothetical protein
MVASPEWLNTEWLLSNFSKTRKVAIERYKDFVLQGKNLPSPWENLKNQIFLGDEEFVEEMLCKLKLDQELSEIPSTQRRAFPKPLGHYSRKYQERNKGIIAAYRSGGYSMKEIGDHFGIHYSSVSKIIKADENSKFKT